jgi:peptidoglycan/LPS O-acetylase OafA/YrhL
MAEDAPPAGSDALPVHDATAARAGGAIHQAGEVRSARIESLRAFAALAVLVGHVWGTTHHFDYTSAAATYLDRVIYGGGFGVYLFFALSGYLLYWPFAKRAFAAGRAIDVRRYALNRALRILPLYYAALAIVLVWQHGGGSLRQWLLYATFLENFDKDVLLEVNGAAWSVAVELQFYVVLPFLALGIASMARGSLARAAIAIGALAAASFALRWFTFYEIYNRSGEAAADQALRYSLPSTFFFFTGGMLLCLLRLHWERRPPRLPAPLGTAEVWVLASAATWAVVFHYYGREYLAAIASALLVAACVLPLRGGLTLRPLEWRPLAALGVASYSLYLWHVPILTELGDASWTPRGFAGLLPVAGAICVAVAFASYRLVEAPFLRLRRRWGSTAAAQTEPGGGAGVSPAAARA